MLNNLFTIAFIVLTSSNAAFAQKSVFSDTRTPYSIGFKALLLADSSRQFKFNDQTQSGNRPIRLFVWYPSKSARTPSFINFEDYVFASSLKKEASQLTAAEKLQLQQRLVTSLEYFKVTNEQVASLMKTPSNSVTNAPEIPGKFPLLVFGNVGDGFHFTAMAEFLASNGYVVASLPSLGPNEGEPCRFDLTCLRLQQKDMEFVIDIMSQDSNVDASQIGLLAWSFSGLAVAHVQMKNRHVKAVVSLDAATGYQYGKEILDQSKELDLNQINVPFLHFHGLGTNSNVRKNFDFFNSVPAREKCIVTFENLQHSDFVPLYASHVRHAKKTNDEMVNSAIRKVNLITLEFLNAYVKDSQKIAKEFERIAQTAMNIEIQCRKAS